MNDGRMNNVMGNGFGMEIGSDDVVRFNILERIGRLSHNDKSGWSKEVNIVAWNDYPPKVDIREWDPNHERMSRGVTLHELEAVKLANMLLKKFPPEEYANNKYQNKGARNRSASGRGNGNGRSSGYGNSGGRNYSNGSASNGNGQGYGSRDRNYVNGSGYNGNGQNGGNYRDGMNAGYRGSGQSERYTNGAEAQGEYYGGSGNEVRYESMGGQNYGYDEGRGTGPQRDAGYNNNAEAETREFGLMGDGEQRYQACGDAGELYEDYIPGLDEGMEGGDADTGKSSEVYAGSDYEALYDSGEGESFDDGDRNSMNAVMNENFDHMNEAMNVESSFNTHEVEDCEIEAADSVDEDNVTPSEDFRGEGPDEAGDEEVEPF